MRIRDTLHLSDILVSADGVSWVGCVHGESSKRDFVQQRVMVLISCAVGAYFIWELANGI